MKYPRIRKVFEKPNEYGSGIPDPLGGQTPLKKTVTNEQLNACRPNLQDLLETAGDAFFQDRWWKHVYGREIPYFARALLNAQFVEDWCVRGSSGVQGVSKTEFKEAAGKTINQEEQAAAGFIKLAVDLGLFSETAWENDQRVKVIHFTPEELEKARLARKAPRIAAAIVAAQIKDPNNLEAGKTDENAPIYCHFMTVMGDYKAKKAKKANNKPE